MKKPFLLPLLACLTFFGSALSVRAQERPNIILIFTDDQGYGDVGCFGAKGFQTPNLDRMAAQGIRFTSFYVNCPVCSGSRAALMTGRHFQRTGVPPVMFPGNKNGLSPEEITIARLLKRLGYITGIIGKWHLGHLAAYLPTRHGFDSYYGIPYSNDMAIDPVNARFAKNVEFRLGFTEDKARTEKPKNGWAPLMRGEEVIEFPADQTTLTKRYTQEAVRFISTNKDKNFFLYLPHTMPHGPMAVSPGFQGRTKSLFGDVIEEVDWSVGEVLKAVKENGLDEKTLVIFTTDNGTASGSSGPLRGKKATLYEGGVRVPCIMRWPGKIPAKSESAEIAATIDFLPTLAKIAGGEAPKDRAIDGKDIRPLMFNEAGAKTPHEHYILAHGAGAVRSGAWKFYPWPEGQMGKGKKEPPKEIKGPKVQLYDLANDLAESKNVAEQHPEVVARLTQAYQQFLEDLKKNNLPGKKK
jgi:arylsulfatase A